jgi:acetyl-CoA acyltransferase
MSLREVVLVDAVRTPFGKAGGVYANTRSDDLGVAVVKALLDRSAIDRAAIDDVGIAATSQVGDQGVTLGRSIGLLAGLPNSVPGYAVDRMCSGAMTAVTQMAASIAAGMIDIGIAGGVEHMGRHPIGASMDVNPRFVSERLVAPDALNMGVTAENLHDRFPALTKERADAYAVASQRKTALAYAEQRFAAQLIPVAARDADGAWSLVSRDEPPRPDTTLEALSQLRTPFRPNGRVTAGNAAGLNDGATAALVMRESTALTLGLTPRARMVSFAFAGVEPEIMGYGPVPSTNKALAKAGLAIDDMDVIEINEAFAVQVLAFLDHFRISDDDLQVNPFGGAIAVGHPLASSGIRLMANMVEYFSAHPGAKYGLTTMCIGLGMGASVIWENVQ